jgi:hypothetical protein
MIKKKLLNIFLIPIIVFFIGCSKDSSSSSSNNTSNISYSPPSWIIGKYSVSAAGIETGFIFTSNDFQIIQANQILSQKEYNQNLKNSGFKVEIIEEKTDNQYKITTNYDQGQTTVYTFKKISSTEIMWVEISGKLTKR